MCPQGSVGTHSKLDTCEVHVSLLQPIIEVLCIVGGVAFSICGHAEDYQGFVDLRQAAQVGLGRQGCHHLRLSPPLRNRAAGGKACQEALHTSPINLKPSLEMEEDPHGRSEHSGEGGYETRGALQGRFSRWALGCVRAASDLTWKPEATPKPPAPSLPGADGGFVHCTEPAV